ncbi:O-antigen ligase family protein [Uliginosibacterium aquaticum]|uniref:O-antigen ligase family protein n=1 Tax=Uliginosibacterium aquaticum TaxID=2731212 RepID=A0ABX2IE37_9RHOO|nr:O-antigen ligase family protein [Uliginosibacterium aquaticum]NSL54043.1 O-antigen ligase family protein [Uliginosibacterium aquaticum]
MAAWLERVDGWAFVVLLGVLAWAPVPLASNRTWALGFLVLTLLGVLGLVVLAAAVRGDSLLERLGAGKWPLGCIVLFGLWIAGQRLPLMGNTPISAELFNSLQYLLATMAYAAAFALVLLLVNTERRVMWLAGMIVGAGVFQALLAIGLFASRAEHIYLFMNYQQGSRAMGTFANFDHLAGYMQLCIAAGVGVMLARMGSSGAVPNRRQRLVAVLKFMLSGKMLVRLMLVIMVITLVLTRSRMGNVAFFSSLLVVGGLGMLNNPRLRRSAFWLVLSLIVVDVVIVGQWVGLDRVVQRLQNTAVETEHAQGEESLEQRAETPRQALGMALERPLTGFGAGSFYTVFPRFKSADKEGYWDHAHNDYVQIAAETGFVGLSLLATALLLTIGRITRLWNERESRLNRGMAFGVAMAICSLLIHSWVDFNLQIPANALTFCVLLALVWVLVPRRADKNQRSSA